MRVACIAHLSEVSGAGVALLNVVSGLRSEGIEADLILPGGGPLAERARSAGVKPYIIENPEVNFGGGFGRKLRLLQARQRYISQLSQFLKQGHYNIAYVNTSATVFAGVAAQLAHVPIVWHIHETLDRSRMPVRVKATIIRKLADGLIYASESGKSTLPHPTDKPSIIARNAIAAGDLMPLGKRKFTEIRTDAPVLILANGTSYRKAPDVLLAGISAAAAALPKNYCVVIAGPPPEEAVEAEVARLAASPPLKGHVEFPGTLNKLVSLYAKADVFISPSRNEAMPIAIVEAMAAGIPVIATDVGDCAHLLNNGERGWLVPVESPEAIAHALTEVLAHPEEARRRAQAAFDFVRETYATPEFWKPLAEFLRALQK